MLYFIVTLFVLVIVFKMYISIKHPFWSRQPVFHIYNLYYWFHKGIIYKTLPKIDKKYYDMTMTHYKYNNLSEKEKDNITKFVVDNWYSEKMSINPYMNNLNYISIIKNKGVICGEVLTMNNIPVMYVDYLCVNKKYRKQNIAPKLIYNFFLQYYNDSKIFLFKWENKNMNILPLCVYNVLHYKDIIVKNNNNTPTCLNIVKIDKGQLHLINENEIKKMFNVTIIQNITTLLADNYVSIYASLKKNKLVGLYFFKKYNNNVYNCYASIKYDAKSLFIDGFKLILQSFKKCSISIDDISHSGYLIDTLSIFKPFLVETHSYYFYNYIKISENSKDVFILN